MYRWKMWIFFTNDGKHSELVRYAQPHDEKRSFRSTCMKLSDLFHSHKIVTIKCMNLREQSLFCCVLTMNLICFVVAVLGEVL